MSVPHDQDSNREPELSDVEEFEVPTANAESSTPGTSETDSSAAERRTPSNFAVTTTDTTVQILLRT